jgi:hypothetical protein
MQGLKINTGKLCCLRISSLLSYEKSKWFFPDGKTLFSKLFPILGFFKRTIATRFKIYCFFLFTIVFTSHSKHCLQTTYDSPSSRNISAAKVLFFNPQLQFSGPDSAGNDCLIQSEKRDLGNCSWGERGLGDSFNL